MVELTDADITALYHHVVHDADDFTDCHCFFDVSTLLVFARAVLAAAKEPDNQGFSRGTTPTVLGVYEIKIPELGDAIRIAHWDGEVWSWFANNLAMLQEHIAAKKVHRLARFEWREFIKEQP